MNVNLQKPPEPDLNPPVEDPDPALPPVEEPEHPEDPGPAEDPGKQPVRGYE